MTGGLVVEKELPKLVADQEMSTQIDKAGSDIAISGQGLFIFSAIFQFFSKTVMNHLLASVRSLSVITHFMMMKLYMEDFTIAFFSHILEYVAFDFVWFAEDIYDATFDLPDDEPYNDAAEQIGYESSYITINSGSITLFIALLVFKQLLFKGLSKLTS